MKKILLASVAYALFGASVSFAAMPSLDMGPALSTAVQNDFLTLAKDGNDDNGNDDNGGGGNSGHSGGDDDNDNDNDDNDDDSNDDSNDDNDDSASSDSSNSSPLSGSNRLKKRIPGGSGCDDPGDAAEHAACGAR